MRRILTVGIGGALAAPAAAAELSVTIEIPKLKVAEYHRPYVTSWIETRDGSHAADLGVWYDFTLPEKRGNSWLKDMRLWWRRSGRNLDMPVDGLSSATRAPGTHDLDTSKTHDAVEALKPGEYVLVVEAAREVGGREVVRIPFQWPVSSETAGEANGAAELGRVTLNIKP
ncbi:MAG: DUF2271 domain-containing protein [Hyphomicrobiales bacterium]